MCVCVCEVNHVCVCVCEVNHEVTFQYSSQLSEMNQIVNISASG